jgi:transcriptional regulator
VDRNRESLVQGTLDMLVLQALTHGDEHGWGISQRIEALSGEVFAVNQGAIYPALQRLRADGRISARWRTTDQKRRARYYSLTASGRRQLGEQVLWWTRVAGGVNAVLHARPAEA